MAELKIENNLRHDIRQELFDREWEESQANPLIVGLNASEGLRDTLEELSGFSKSFKSSGILDIMECSDGRVNGDSMLSQNEKLGLAGSGILFSSSENEEFVKNNKGKLKIVTSHDECGAGAIKFADMLKKGESLPEGVRTSDELAQYFAKKQAALLGAEYHHLEKKDFSAEIHNERMVIIDGTARFNTHQVPDLPPRFISAALGLGVEVDYVAREAEVLAGISLGDHGFDSRFTVENPFYIIIFATGQKQLTDLGEALTNFMLSSQGRVKIVGMVVSSEQNN